MALTLANQVRFSIGGRYMTHTDVTFDTSYPTGGWSLTPTQLGLPLDVNFAYAVNNGVTAVGAVNLVYDKANQKLMAFAGGSSSTPAAELANTTNVAADLVNTRLIAVGK